MCNRYGKKKGSEIFGKTRKCNYLGYAYIAYFGDIRKYHSGQIAPSIRDSRVKYFSKMKKYFSRVVQTKSKCSLGRGLTTSVTHYIC